ncbi:MAG TPA: DUF4112 domain-containing protein [Kofleriaceae bacterium]|nr:DUF4112 domain-containing protein [Kofleriaceae bacterium]
MPGRGLTGTRQPTLRDPADPDDRDSDLEPDLTEPDGGPAGGDMVTTRGRAGGDAELDLAVRIARWTDSRFLDPIIGMLVPGLGDLLTAAVGLFIVRLAARRGLPRVVIARMLVNLGIDTAVGAIPLVGDIFDFAWRANRRNVALLEARHPGRARPGDWLYVAGAAALLVAAMAVPIALLVWAIRAL